MSEGKNINLTKQTLPQLQELLQRQNALLQNKSLLQQLKDKGESIKQLHDKINKEIDHRNTVDTIQESLSTLSLDSCKENAGFLREKHVQYVCGKDKSTQDTRYRPHRTLIHKEKKLFPNKPQKEFVEVTAASEPKLRHEPTKFIPLPESLVIQSEQALKLVEEQAKRSLANLHDSFDDENSSNDEHCIENENSS